MPNPASFQIEPKLISEVAFAERDAIYEDQQKAQQFLDSSPLKILAVLVGGAALFLAGFVFWGILNFFGHNLDKSESTLVLTVLAVIVGIVVIPLVSVGLFKRMVFRKMLRKFATDRLKTNEKETISIAVSKCQTIYNTQPLNLSALNNFQHDADVCLNQSEQLFSERAFTPFWDSIEEAIGLLKKFNDNVHLINASAKNYYGLLEGREHTFPSFPVKSGQIPSLDPLVQRLQQTIARAHRDFQFATIYEQRKTTSAVVAGFRNMQEAITHLGNDIVSSISDLQNSLESGLENISYNIRDGFENAVESQQQSAAELRETLDGHGKEANHASERDAKHQKFAEAALDNIQNRRKPRLVETKEPFRTK